MPLRNETFQTPAEVFLDIRLGAGEIRLETGDLRETSVELSPLRGNDAGAAAVEEARVEVRDRGRHEIVVDVAGSRGGIYGRDAEVRVGVRAPHGASVKCKTGSATVEGRGRFGEIQIETGSGDVEFEEVASNAKVSAASGNVQISRVGGDARLNTASGDLQVTTIAGDAKLNSASGDIRLGDVGGRLEANSASGGVEVGETRSEVSVSTASGDQRIGSVTEGSVSLKSASGDLRVGIRQGSRLWVDARSRAGEVSSELELSDVASEGEGPFVELRANTMSGDVAIVRAQSGEAAKRSR